MLGQNPVLYEVYEIKRPELAGELMYGISIVHPGKVGEEYFMTKGHFHKAIRAGVSFVAVHFPTAGSQGVEECLWHAFQGSKY